MKTLILAAIRCSLMFTAVAALSIVYPASVQAGPTKYRYTGNPFTFVSGPYTTSDFVTVTITLADALGPNFSGFVSPPLHIFRWGADNKCPQCVPRVDCLFRYGRNRQHNGVGHSAGSRRDLSPRIMTPST